MTQPNHKSWSSQRFPSNVKRIAHVWVHFPWDSLIWTCLGWITFLSKILQIEGANQSNKTPCPSGQSQRTWKQNLLFFSYSNEVSRWCRYAILHSFCLCVCVFAFCRAQQRTLKFVFYCHGQLCNTFCSTGMFINQSHFLLISGSVHMWNKAAVDGPEKIAMRSGSDANCAIWFTWNSQRSHGDNLETKQSASFWQWHMIVHSRSVCDELLLLVIWFVLYLFFVVHSFMTVVDLCVTTLAHFQQCL